jgi:hypothetical protein
LYIFIVCICSFMYNVIKLKSYSEMDVAMLFPTTYCPWNDVLEVVALVAVDPDEFDVDALKM